MSFKAIRHAVFVRSSDACEACGAHITEESMHADHFWGRGKGRPPEAVETVWALCLSCDEAKTANRPDASRWLRLFSSHCARWNYSREHERAIARLQFVEARR